MDNGAGAELEPDAARPTKQKKQWSELSQPVKTAIVIGAIAEIVLTTIALRDLLRRPAHEVRGWKPLWALSFSVQPFGAPLYLVVGRRRSAD